MDPPAEKISLQERYLLWRERGSYCLKYWPPLAYKSVEFLTVVGIFGVSCYIGYWLVFGPVTDPRYTRMVGLVDELGQSWKAFLLLMVPLFYRSTRTFMDEVQEAWGMKRRATPAAPLPVQGTNPDPPTAV